MRKSIRNSLLISFVYLSISTTAFGQEFSASINVAGGTSNYELTFGFHPNATDGFDTALDQYAPPAPPPPAFDAALSWGSDRYYAQILAGDGDLSEHVYDIALSYPENNLITISWDNSDWSTFMNSCQLQDAFGGVMININMLEESSATLTNTAFNTLKLKITPRESGPSDIYGCTDPTATNYGHDCEGDYVGDPTEDDGCCEYPSGGDPNFEVCMNATAGGTQNYALCFGVSPNASDGFDAGIDQYAPPAPPPPSFDAALAWEGDRYYTQILATTTDERVYDVQLQFSDNSLIILEWNASLLADLGEFMITDAFGGMMINVDMTMEGSVTLTNSAFNTLKLYMTPNEMGDPTDIYGCTDESALNYGHNCEGEFVGDPTIDDGCCDYPSNENPFEGQVTPTPSSGVFQGQATLSGTPASDGDWIAAFDEDGNIAGAQALTIYGEDAYINLTIYGDDSQSEADEGMNAGESFYLKLWDASENMIWEYGASFDGWYNNNGAPMDGYNDPYAVFDFSSNTPPEAEGYDVYIEEDSWVEIELSGFDADGDELSFEIVDGPEHGTFESGTYYPHQNFYGDDAIVYRAFDGSAYSNNATISITVESVNDLPEVNAGDDQAATEGDLVHLSGSGSDVEDELYLEWSGPPEINFEDASNPETSFIAPEVDSNTEFLLTLTGTDSDGAQVSDEVSITVQSEGAPPPPGFEFITTPASGILIGQVLLDGSTLTTQDWIAAFDEDGNCAGAQTLTLNGGISWMNLPIYGNDTTTPEDEGMDPGENFTLTLWNSSENEYWDHPDAFDCWYNNNGAPMGDCGGVNEIYNFPTTVVDEIALNAGWDLMSFDVHIEINSPADVFAGLVNSGILVAVTGYDNGALFYDPSLPPFLNSLTAIEAGFGYWIKVNSSVTISAEGLPLGDDFSKDIAVGWNLMGYWPANSQAPQDAFAEQVANGNLVAVTGYDSGALFYDPSLPPFLNSLTSMENGFGYWAKVNDAVPGFVYPAAGLARVPVSQAQETNPEIVKTSEFMFVNGAANFHDLNYTIGDRVEIRTENELLVGELVILEDNFLMTGPIYGDDWTTEEVDGALNGEHLSFIYNGNKAEQTILYAGTMDLAKVDLDFRIIPNVYALNQNYPNPFNPVTTITYDLMKDGFVSLTVYNMMGQEIANLVSADLKAGVHSIQWNGTGLSGQVVSSGVYFYILNTDEFTSVKKMVFMK